MDNKTDLDNKIKKFRKKMANTKCQCCRVTPLQDTCGEWYCGKWWCFEHVEILFKKEAANNLSELMMKTNFR